MSSPEEEIIVTRTYVVPLGRLYWGPRRKRAKKAIRLLREFVIRHLRKYDIKEIKLDSSVNEYLWSRNIEKPPRRIKVKVEVVREDEERYARVTLA
ncbi:MAG: 50S ribosomal protein L31e [Thermoprotei archaeon]|nr:MAG: 50S ribosomal protein L31e [Thermoprotei archaeon]RLF00494.1 MAG: 50S ribosomal protein L31e [Thermoprotei archaeon]